MRLVKNPVAKSLNDRLFKLRVVAAKKGKGSYSRKGKNRERV
jgi:stalled ribosome alternative rescue factor ArfA